VLHDAEGEHGIIREANARIRVCLRLIVLERLVYLCFIFQLNNIFTKPNDKVSEGRH